MPELAVEQPDAADGAGEHGAPQLIRGVIRACSASEPMNEGASVTTRGLVRALGVFLFELLVCALALIVALRTFEWLPGAWQQHPWIFVALLAGLYLAFGATPLPWQRRRILMAVAAFVVPLGIIGWIDWRVQYFLLFEHSGAWENLPRVILSFDNLAVAALLSAATVLGERLARMRRSAVHAV